MNNFTYFDMTAIVFDAFLQSFLKTTKNFLQKIDCNFFKNLYFNTDLKIYMNLFFSFLIQ
jgi:hypothetical protein